jgi:signal transduction histidine kinase
VLHEFLATHRDKLITLCSAKVGRRAAPRTNAELGHGVRLFIDQLAETLRLDAASYTLESLQVSGPGGGEMPDNSEIGNTAAKHGNELQQRGFTVEQVVHDYGDLCQAITELAIERSAQVTADEFRTLNRCLDNAIASAVTEFGRQRDLTISEERARATSERLGYFAHELRNLLGSAMLALTAIKMGKAGFAGATAAALDRSLLGLRDLIDRTLAEVRLSAGMPVSQEVIPLFEFVAELQVAAAMEAQAKACVFTVFPVDQGLTVEADRQMLSSAVTNLLQNAFKFTRPLSNVSLRAYAAGDRVLMDIADECGGLPPGKAEEIFHPFTQQATDRTGLGLGLSIARRAVEANGGQLQIRNLPGAGCIFTIDLPRRPRESS